MAVVPRGVSDGFVVVRGFVGPTDLARLRAAFDLLLEIARRLDGPTEVDGSRFVVDREPFRIQRVTWCSGAAPDLQAFGGDIRFLGLAGECLGSNHVVQLIQQAHFKLPGDGVAFAWHQDASNRRYGTDLWTDVDGFGSFVQIAVAVDPMGARNGGLSFIPGSQRLGFRADPITGELPENAFDRSTRVTPELDAGDAVVFGPFVVHGSEPNDGAVSRRTFLQGYALPGANRRVYVGSGLGVERPATSLGTGLFGPGETERDVRNRIR